MRMKAGLSAEGLQYLHIASFQNCFMIAVGHVAVILAKLSFFNMKLKMNFTERLEDTGSSFQVIVN
jgi:hypothetical protein